MNEIKPFAMDFLYLGPMLEVARVEDLRFRGYPQDPQLQSIGRINKQIIPQESYARLVPLQMKSREGIK